MDWSKAKNVMIIALLITNIFLLYTYSQKYSAKVEMTDSINFSQMLEERGLHLKTKMPEGKSKMPSLTLSYTSPTKQKIKRLLGSEKFNPNDGRKQNNYAEASDRLMQELDFSLADFVREGPVIENDKGDMVVTYYSTFDGYPIHAQPIHVHFREGKLSKLTGKVAVAMPSTKRGLSVIPPEEALLIFMREDLKAKEAVTVNGIELVYWANNEDMSEEQLVSDTAFPAWKISAEGKDYYIDANRR